MSPLWPRKSRSPEEPPDHDGESPPASVTSDPSTQRALGLLSLLELSNELNARQDVFEIAEVALFNLMGHLGCSRGSLWLMPEDTAQDVVLVRAQGVQEPLARGIGALWSRWFLAGSAGMLEPVVVEKAAGFGTPPPGLDLAEQAGIALLSPLTVRKKMVGLFALGRRVNGGDFGLLDLEVLQASLNLVGIAIDNANLYNRAIENNRRLRLANDKLRELDHMKSEFLNNMNHELRTPLTVIIAYLDSLIDKEMDAETAAERLTIARDQAQHLHSLVVNVLEFSDIADNSLEIRISRGDVVSELAAYHEERRPGVVADLRELVFSSASDVPPAIFDRERLIHVVDALVENAVKFTPRGTRIQLRVDSERTPERETVRISVEDDGPGIPEDRLPHVFDSFRQGDGSDTREQGGMGLGLALARELAEKMGGELTVETEIGKGTVFALRLPAA